MMKKTTIATIMIKMILRMVIITKKIHQQWWKWQRWRQWWKIWIVTLIIITIIIIVTTIIMTVAIIVSPLFPPSLLPLFFHFQHHLLLPSSFSSYLLLFPPSLHITPLSFLPFIIITIVAIIVSSYYDCRHFCHYQRKQQKRRKYNSPFWPTSWKKMSHSQLQCQKI